LWLRFPAFGQEENHECTPIHTIVVLASFQFRSQRGARVAGGRREPQMDTDEHGWDFLRVESVHGRSVKTRKAGKTRNLEGKKGSLKR
jgi:hypothetical protein